MFGCVPHSFYHAVFASRLRQDGDLDLFIAAGNVNRQSSSTYPNSGYPELWRNDCGAAGPPGALEGLPDDLAPAPSRFLV